MTQDVYVPSTGRGVLDSSSQAGTEDGDEDEDDDDNVDQRHEELGPSQLHDAPSTHPTPPLALGDAIHMTLTLQV